MNWSSLRYCLGLGMCRKYCVSELGLKITINPSTIETEESLCRQMYSGMKFEFTQHARQRCKERRIRFQDVKAVVSNPSTTKITAAGTIEARGRIRSKTLVVIFAVKRDLRIIITAYYEV
ncbi:DUF4258 domain-containing protein [Candidatus Parcubacteria bacterium]|nr:MAG: DUF4258 domain-containing protein [Candidatus Parcubacteria bacterium]